LRSSAVSLPHFLKFSLKALISGFSVLSTALIVGWCVPDFKGPANVHQLLSRFLAASTNVVIVVG
jgi:hypothetical protein